MVEWPNRNFIDNDSNLEEKFSWLEHGHAKTMNHSYRLAHVEMQALFSGHYEYMIVFKSDFVPFDGEAEMMAEYFPMINHRLSLESIIFFGCCVPFICAFRSFLLLTSGFLNSLNY